MKLPAVNSAARNAQLQEAAKAVKTAKQRVKALKKEARQAKSDLKQAKKALKKATKAARPKKTKPANTRVAPQEAETRAVKASRPAKTKRTAKAHAAKASTKSARVSAVIAPRKKKVARPDAVTASTGTGPGNGDATWSDGEWTSDDAPV